jgi:hypothetical protein
MYLELPKYKIFDTNFTHAPGMCWKWEPTYFKWYRGNEYHDICFFTDNSLPLVEKIICKKKIGIISEPPDISNKIFSFNCFNYIKDNHRFFDYILTPYKDLISLNPNKFLYYHQSFPWISKEEQKIYEKKKMTSIIASKKTITEGHRLRHQIIKLFSNSFDVYGNGYGLNQENKTFFLQDYRFSICVLNSKHNGYMTEAVGDCFATGTIPIYWGDKSICDIYNPDGIIFFDNLTELNSIIKLLNEKIYDSKLKAIEENFKIATEFKCHEDFFYKKYPNLFY